MQELRLVFRLLRKNSGFTLVCVLALAIGIGANTALFTMVNGILLRELNFRDAKELVWIWSTRIDRDKAFFSMPDFLDYQEQNRSLQENGGVWKLGREPRRREQPGAIERSAGHARRI